ncbi:minor tail protein [Arthrobacter phage Zeina]|nr:minor tail protein [Arthrobacter phage Zeina]
MLTKAEVTNSSGVVLELPIGEPYMGYLVQEIEGLDPTKATLVTSSFANEDGEEYHTSRRDARDIIFKIKLEPDYSTGSAWELRQDLYGFFMPKSEVSMRFYVEAFGYVDITGVVEIFNCPMFVKEPEATVSIHCAKSDFLIPDPVIFNGVTTWSDIIEAEIDYDGTIETGIAFNITADRSLPEGLTIYHRGPDNSFNVLEFTEPLSAGDTLDISTVNGAKGATLTNDVDGTDSILFGVTPQSAWINLFPGKNYIRVFVDVEGAAIPYTMTYTKKHGGL